MIFNLSEILYQVSSFSINFHFLIKFRLETFSSYISIHVDHQHVFNVPYDSKMIIIIRTVAVIILIIINGVFTYIESYTRAQSALHTIFLVNGSVYIQLAFSTPWGVSNGLA